MHHAIFLQSCINTVIIAMTNWVTIMWVLWCHTDGLYCNFYCFVITLAAPQYPFHVIPCLILHRHCAVGLDPPDSYEFHAIFLPEAAERLLILARNIQHRYIKIPEKTLALKDDLIKAYKEVFDGLQWLFSGHIFLTTNGMPSRKQFCFSYSIICPFSRILKLCIFKEVFSDSNNIILWHESKDINKKKCLDLYSSYA